MAVPFNKKSKSGKRITYYNNTLKKLNKRHFSYKFRYYLIMNYLEASHILIEKKHIKGIKSLRR